jgi:long-subunit acyl-CoA synthetase (AMP-forming)
MTETCAGSIYGKDCHRYDIAQKHKFAYLGPCMPGIQMRVTVGDGTPVPANTIGNLEVSGPLIFSQYFSNVLVTAEARAPEGWFITGDCAFIDSLDQLNQAGRVKDIVIALTAFITSQKNWIGQ